MAAAWGRASGGRQAGRRAGRQAGGQAGQHTHRRAAIHQAPAAAPVAGRQGDIMRGGRWGSLASTAEQQAAASNALQLPQSLGQALQWLHQQHGPKVRARRRLAAGRRRLGRQLVGAAVAATLGEWACYPSIIPLAPCSPRPALLARGASRAQAAAPPARRPRCRSLQDCSGIHLARCQRTGRPRSQVWGSAGRKTGLQRLTHSCSPYERRSHRWHSSDRLERALWSRQYP